jgi:hypothetical protein
MLKKIFISFSLLNSIVSSYAQETDYTDVVFDHQLLPSLPQYSDYKSFDLTVLTTKENQDAAGTGFNIAFLVKVGNLSQVNDGGDFHVVSLLQRYGGKMTSPSTADINVVLSSTAYDKYGNVVKTGSVSNEHYPINFGRNLSKEEMANADLVRKLCMEKIIEASLQPLIDGVSGAKLKPTTRIASLDDVKKKPELQDFDAQVKTLKPVIEKEGLAGFKKAAEGYVAYWEKMSNYSGDGDKEEVRRAALQNLALYHIAAGNADKAKEYIDAYKQIDKQIKAMFGLVKYKNSEELEKLAASLNPPATETVAVTGEKVMTKTEIADNYQYLIIDGTATITGKKIAGTYNGLIKVYKIPVNSFGNIVNLDPENIAVRIETKDDAGQPKVINTFVSNVEELKDKSGTAYTTQRFGTKLMGDATFNFMKSTFNSPKITVYRSIIPATGEYVVKKAGDDKGAKSSLLNARKNLEEYLGDCPSIVEKFKNGALDKKATVETIAAEYSKCQ